MRDIDVRQALLAEMRRIHENDSATLIVEELGLCQGLARVDVAVVNGSVHGYEIKSERDTLVRLPGQRDVYNQTLDFVTIVTARTHARKVRESVPRWWGIWTVVKDRDSVQLEILRKPKPNPKINPFALAQLLWRDEALDALSEHGLATGMLSKTRHELWRRLATDLTLDELGRAVRDRLKRRGASWRVPESRARGGDSFRPSAM